MEDTKDKKGVTYKCTGIIVLVVLVLSAALCAAIVIPLFQSIKEQTPKVEIPTISPIVTLADTECGQVEGIVENGVHVFKGIPYAEPPIGPLRWKPPILRFPKNGNCWKDTFKATEFGNVCTQDMGYGVIGDEDCLLLNVWTPILEKDALLPVMVYIHGGSLQTLNGGIPDGSPTAKLASDTQAVYVSFNYRLNVFGFLALDLLTNNSSTNSSGNYGFMDQLLVLDWVQRNIRNFGGNPSLGDYLDNNLHPRDISNKSLAVRLRRKLKELKSSKNNGLTSQKVTLFGESSGGTSVMALLASPLSQSLFHRAWMMSGSTVMNRTLSQASADNLIFLDNTNCTDLSCLYDLKAVQLMKAIPYNVWPRWSMNDLTYLPTKGLFNGALAIIDGYVLEDDPMVVFRAGRGMNVPVMIGTLAQETDFNPPADVRSWTWDNYTDHVSSKLKPFGDNILERALDLYPPGQNTTPEYQLTTMSTDIRVTCPNHVLANELASSSKLRVYRYVVTSYPAKPIHVYGLYDPAYAFHSWDSIVFFGGLNTYFDKPSKDNLAFQAVQEQEMIYFARNGFPYSIRWESYPNSTGILSTELNTTSAYHSEHCDFWINNGFFSYGWIN